jgi:hypothetical protein
MGGSLAVAANGKVKRHTFVCLSYAMWSTMHSVKENHVFLYCPIREISVQRRGTRVKRFFVSEAQGAELENLTESRQSGTPGDFAGASFWYFLREKVLRVSGAKSRIEFILFTSIIPS